MQEKEGGKNNTTGNVPDISKGQKDKNQQTEITKIEDDPEMNQKKISLEERPLTEDQPELMSDIQMASKLEKSAEIPKIVSLTGQPLKPDDSKVIKRRVRLQDIVKDFEEFLEKEFIDEELAKKYDISLEPDELLDNLPLETVVDWVENWYDKELKKVQKEVNNIHKS